MEKKVKIIFEDENFLVMDKPSGMTTTKEKKGEIETLEDYLREYKPNNLPRNGIIHRLDKGTSGIVLTAKNQMAYDFFKNQFKNRNVVKKYYCLVGGETSMDGSIDWPIGRSKYGFGKFGVIVDGRNALTEFKLLKKYQKQAKKYSLLEVNLKTGRTHQIRVHFSHLKWPLVGDRLYGGENDLLKRPFLHAFYLKIKDPVSNEEKEFKSDLAQDLVEHLSFYEEK